MSATIHEFLRQESDCYEYLQLVLAQDKTYFCAELGRATPYLVQVTTGSRIAGTEDPGDFVGLYDLDGHAVDSHQVGEWELAGGGVPQDVLDQIEDGWASGLATVSRVSGEVQS